MSAVLLAVFNDYETAEGVRVALVRDGFPTDRIQLTASCELGCAGLQPADTPHGKCLQYFHTLLKREDEQHYAEILTQRVENGAATITVLPRGAIETARATEILEQAHPADMVGHDLAKHGWERLLGSARLDRELARDRLHLLPSVPGTLALTAHRPAVRCGKREPQPVRARQ
jgi:hypothetical protein